MGAIRDNHRRALGQLAATQAAGPAAARSGAAATEYELQRARLGIDLRRLHDIQALERKIALKRELLPGYAPWVDGILEAEAKAEKPKGVQDDVLVQIMIWRIDVGDYAGALPLAAYVLRWRLALPERFSRSPATLIAEEVAEAALKALAQGGPFDLQVLLEVEALTADHDMIDQANAKLQKAIGQLLARRADELAADADGPAGARGAALRASIPHLRRALELDAKCGVKKQLEVLERKLKAAEVAGDVAPDETTGKDPTDAPSS